MHHLGANRAAAPLSPENDDRSAQRSPDPSIAGVIIRQGSQPFIESQRHDLCASGREAEGATWEVD
jgi:hypothetical protein